ncbi:MAG: transposase [Clostridia bacterium]|nr:transposase [Clostridia bacterium]MBR2986257.1 transposase [Clostridia bacterium]
MEKEQVFPQRKTLRLQNFDYSTCGAYFITICTKNRKKLFAPVGADSISARMVERIFLKTIEQYPGVECPIYVVMPNHFHAIIVISRADMESAPTLPQIVQSFKRYSTIEYVKMVKDGILPPFDKQIWQRSFYDHVIRNQDDYEEIYKYIYENPMKWEFDSLFAED